MVESSLSLILNLDRLSWEEDSVGDALWDGKYFSGIAFEEDPVSRVVIAVSGFRYGKSHGAMREWDAAGLLREEEYFEQGAPHGSHRKWYSNGHLAESHYGERFINMRRKRWDGGGNLIEEKNLLESDPRWSELEKERKRGPRPIVDIDLATLTFFERPEGWGRNESDLPPPLPPPSLELCRTLEARCLGWRSPG